MEENEKDLQKYSLQKTLYAVRKYRMLSLLGRQEEAEELAQRIRKMPQAIGSGFAQKKTPRDVSVSGR